jgi:quercetin dioxygenase-like cupin family protein
MLLAGAAFISGYKTGLRVGEEFGVKSTHHTLAVMKSHIPAGVELTQHVHSYDHDSLLVSGIATVKVGDSEKQYEGPHMLKIPSGVEHKVTSQTNCEWWCMHEIDENGNIVL